MHPLLLEEVIRACRARLAEGDCPTTQALGRETLEETVVELADQNGRLWEWHENLKTQLADARQRAAEKDVGA